MNELERIVALARSGLEQRRAARPAEVLERQARAAIASGSAGGRFAAALTQPGLSVIAEHKRRSPSAGVIREGAQLEQVIGAYERGGASALSILTEGPSFGGSLDDLRRARSLTALPLLRKDFIVDRYQVAEAAVSGADAVLLIVAALDAQELDALHAYALELGLSAVVEVHSASELERALELGAELIGINNRDLTTLSVDTSTTFTLRPEIPDGIVVVAESGFSRAEQLEALDAAGVDAVLVGEALMRAPDIESACRELTSPFSPDRRH